MAVPPLHHGILHTCISRIRLHETDRHGSAVDQVQQGYSYDESTEEPVGHVNVANLAGTHCAKEHHRKRHPDQGNQDVNRPLEFGIFFAAGVAHWQRNGRCQNNQLPTPKREAGQFVIEQAHMAGSLNHVVGRGKQAATTKRKNHGIGVQGTQPAIAEPRNT